MGEFGDYLKNNNMGGDLASAVGTAEDIYGTVSGAYAYYGAAKALGTQLGLWEGEKDSFERLQEAIDHLQATLVKGFIEIGRYIDLHGQQEKLDTLVLLDDARVKTIGTIATFGQSGLSQGQLEDLEPQSSLESYEDKDLWRLVYHYRAAYSDTWASRVEPPNDGAFYEALTFVLPRYLRAIAIRMTCLAVIFKRPFREGREYEVLEYADRLREIHDRIATAIAVHRPPTLAEMTPNLMEPASPTPGSIWSVRRSYWESKGRLFGAVEAYSTLADVAAYPEPEPKPPNPADYPVPGERLPDNVPPPSPTSPDYVRPDTSAYRIAFDAWRAKTLEPYYRRFVIRHAARSLSARNRLYAAAGLWGIWNSMNILRRTAGFGHIPASPLDGAWSLREFAGVISNAQGTPLPPTAYTMRGLNKAVGSWAPPTSMRDLIFANG